MNIHAVKANSRNMFESRGSIHSRLHEGAIDDSEFHGCWWRGPDRVASSDAGSGRIRGDGFFEKLFPLPLGGAFVSRLDQGHRFEVVATADGRLGAGLERYEQLGHGPDK